MLGSLMRETWGSGPITMHKLTSVEAQRVIAVMEVKCPLCEDWRLHVLFGVEVGIWSAFSVEGRWVWTLLCDVPQVGRKGYVESTGCSCFRMALANFMVLDIEVLRGYNIYRKTGDTCLLNVCTRTHVWRCAKGRHTAMMSLHPFPTCPIIL